MSSPADPSVLVVDDELLRAWPLPVHEGGDKFARGTTVVVAGSARTPGAARLAGESALRMGAGRLEIVTAAAVAVGLGVAIPEALVAPLDCDADDGLCWPEVDDRLEQMIRGADAVLIGPGLLGDTVGEVVTGALRWLGDDARVVLDARALGAMAELDPALVPRGRLVLTPNRQELRQLADGDGEIGDDDECSLAAAVAQRYGAVITCFGHVTRADRCWEVRTGTPGLGTSGSGDVLAGLTLGALVRCGDPAQAACWSSFVHAESGARLARRMGELSFLARDLVSETATLMHALEQPVTLDHPQVERPGDRTPGD